MAEPLFTSEHKACVGCGAAMLLKKIMDIAGKNTIVVIGTGCMEVVSTLYPNTAWKVPLIHSAFANTAATASGVYYSLKNQKRDKKEKVIAIAGDGGTFDIGLQALSGMFARGDKILYICYDNEAYMNTGIQKSGATPLFMNTTTTFSGQYSSGNENKKKNIPFILASHNNESYIATASIGFFDDFEKKLKKAIANLEKGPSYLQVLASCIPGWKIKVNQSIEVARKAVLSKAYLLYEIENGIINLSPMEYSEKIENYLLMQGRFKHLNAGNFVEIKKNIDEEFKRLKFLSDNKIKVF